VRAQFEKRFTSRRMASDYLALYRRLTQQPDLALIQAEAAD
jgi:hypothetical protein